MIALKGLAHGRPIKLHCPERKSTSGPVPKTTLYWGDSSLVLDIGNLPQNIVNALPRAYATTQNAAEWESFIKECLISGKLK